MKIFFLLPVISLLTNSPHIEFTPAFHSDTTIVTHLLDGNLAEWPEEKFITNKATAIRYAVDNDSQMLFLAMLISDKTEQQIIMQQGMRLFIDIKGKKKENRGVQFPLGMETGVGTATMKVFGFGDAEPLPQDVKTEGAINIATAWDTADAMCIEYCIPLKMLEGSVTELNAKKISIGWRINEVDPGSTTQPVTTTSRIVAVRSNNNVLPPANRTTGTNRSDPLRQANAGKIQSFWTTHTINF